MANSAFLDKSLSLGVFFGVYFSKVSYPFANKQVQFKFSVKSEKRFNFYNSVYTLIILQQSFICQIYIQINFSFSVP